MVELRGKIGEEAALADLKLRARTLELELDQKKEIERTIAKCIIKARQDGVVNYAVVTDLRRGVEYTTTVAQGEPVREGQRLLRVCTPDRFRVTVRIRNALADRVRVG
jgi:hypothetical protein